MSKAEERALEKYPFMADNDKRGLEALKYIGMECECVSAFNEVQEAKQAYFIEGYKQAEKDLELTWKDVHAISIIEDKLIRELCMDDQTLPQTQEFYTEVLKRFNKEMKEK